MQAEIPAIVEAGAAAPASVAFRQATDLLLNRDVRKALPLLYRAQQLGYDSNECAAARWDCWMLLGEFEKAWRESDLISANGATDPHQFWNGQSWAGKRIMLRCLHGLGDTIQFIRYVPLLKQTCSWVTVQTHPALVSLLKNVQGVDQVCSWGPDAAENHCDWDIQMEVTELPRAFRTTASTIPAMTPYIQVPRERMQWGADRFPDYDRPRIGIAWQAGSWNPARSIPLDEFSLLLQSERRRFYSLQKEADPATVAKCRGLCDLECYAADIRDTAALILNLDLVITVDTMTAHLAGALGCPVWILLPVCADWRWMLQRSDTPWYPAARIFRQKRPNNWTEVMEEVRDAIEETFTGWSNVTRGHRWPEMTGRDNGDWDGTCRRVENVLGD